MAAGPPAAKETKHVLLGLALAGALAFAPPIAAHSASLGSNIAQARTGQAPVGRWRTGTVRTGIRRPVIRMLAGARRIGDRAVLMAGGCPMEGREFPPTGSGVPPAAHSIIHSLTGEARRADGVIRSPRGEKFAIFAGDLQCERDQEGCLIARALTPPASRSCADLRNMWLRRGRGFSAPLTTRQDEPSGG
jgi:hypothetical protein